MAKVNDFRAPSNIATPPVSLWGMIVTSLGTMRQDPVKVGGSEQLR
jgi:hypothetical protein